MSLEELVKTKAVNDFPSKDDGLTFLVVRYPKNIGRNRYFQWIPQVSPSLGLSKLLKDHRIVWRTFAERYVLEMHATSEAQNKIVELVELIKQGEVVTLLSFQPEWQFSHRHLLKKLIVDRLQLQDKDNDNGSIEYIPESESHKQLYDAISNYKFDPNTVNECFTNLTTSQRNDLKKLEAKYGKVTFDKSLANGFRKRE